MIAKDELKRTVDAYLRSHGNTEAVARALGLARSTVLHRLDRASAAGLITKGAMSSAKASAGDAKADLKITELEQKVKFLAAQNKMLLKDNLSSEQVKAFIHETKQYRPTPPKWTPYKDRTGLTGTPILMGSDWHWGESVSAVQMNYVNAFNQDIAHQRAERFFLKPIDLLMHHMAHPQYDRIIVPFIGDMLSGNIHEELAETNWAPVTVCMIDLLGVLIAGLDGLIKSFKKVYVPWIVGNHGRTHKKMRFKNRAFDNYEWILGHMLARHYQGNDAIHFEIGESANLPFQVYGTKFLLNHGDEFRGGGGISGTWSPLMRGDAKKRKQAIATNRTYNYLLIGHWHFAQELPGMICNGTMKGMDEYSEGNGYEFQLPTQQLFIVHPQWGVTARWPLHLEKPGTTYHKRVNLAA